VNLERYGFIGLTFSIFKDCCRKGLFVFLLLYFFIISIS
jgi:hypothetical protein